MRSLRLPVILCGFALTISGCEKPDLGPEIDVESTIQPLEYSRPSMSPQFNPLDFTIASLDCKDEQYAVLSRPMFKETLKTGQESFTRMVKDTVTKEVVDENGKISSKIEEIERPEVRTRDVTYTVFEVVGDGVYRCPISKLKAFDNSGSPISTGALVKALRKGRRAVLHAPDSKPESYYGRFLDEDTIFLLGEDWVQISP